jgi:hypothetical protein
MTSTTTDEDTDEDTDADPDSREGSRGDGLILALITVGGVLVPLFFYLNIVEGTVSLIDLYTYILVYVIFLRVEFSRRSSDEESSTLS